MNSRKLSIFILGSLLAVSCQTTPYIKETSEKVIIDYKEQDTIQAKNISDLMSKKYNEIVEILNPKFNETIKIKIYPDLSSFSSARSSIGLPPGKPNGGNAIGTTRIMLVSSRYYDVAVHEFTHLVINSFAGAPKYNSWIDESICYYLAEQEYGTIKYLKSNYKSYNYFKEFSQNDFYVKTLYYMGRYIFENYSNEQIRTLLKTRSVSNAFNISTNEYYIAWSNWVEKL
jgi:hypothetical protein